MTCSKGRKNPKLPFNLISSHVNEDKNSTQNNSKISYYIGYLIWQDYLHKLDISYDFEKLINGIQDASEGKCNFKDSKDREDFTHIVKKFQADRAQEYAKRYLEESEKYLSYVSQISNICEVHKDKLYFFISQKGSDIDVHEESQFKFIVKRLNDGELHTVYAASNPIKLNLMETIDGFRQGVKGMKIGEKRIIYIHPSLAYGSGRVCVPPNSLIIFEVEAL